MNILHITKVKNWNGEVQQLFLLVVEQKRKGLDVTVLCPAQSAIFQKLSEKSINTQTFSEKNKNCIKLSGIINKIKKECQINIIHLHSSSLLLASIIYHKFYDNKTPIILAKKSMIRGSSIFSQLKYNHTSIKKIICVSEAVQATLTDLMWEKNIHKISVLYDGINTDLCTKTSPMDIRQQHNLIKSDFIVGNIANHTSAKDLEIFVKTANYIVNTLGLSDVKFFQIGGETKYSKIIHDLAEQYDLTNNLFFMGFQNNASDLLPQFDAMLMTSKREGLPLTIYEAFLYKIPVVSTKAGGIPEAIEHDKTGFLSDIGDFKSLGDNIVRIKKDVLMRKLIVNNAESLLNMKFTQSVMERKTHDVYLECLNDSSRIVKKRA
ncbi:glycosyltransferase family 4 protein [Labilibaculum euxinus]